MDEGQAQTNGNTSETGGSFLTGGTEDDEQEESGHHKFTDECLCGSVSEVIGVNSIDCQTAEMTGDPTEKKNTDESSHDLGSYIHKGILARDFAVDEHSKSDGGVDVATRNGSDGIVV